MARVNIFGRSGVGKSWYLGKFLEDAVPGFNYAVHFDIEDEEQGLSQREDAIYKSFYVDKDFYEQQVEYEGREMPLVSAVILHNKRVRIVPDSLTPDEQRELYAQICGLAMRLGKTEANVLISADEAHNIAPDIGDNLDERVERMLTGGRKKGVEYVFCTQRPSNLHEEAFSQANYGIYFSLTKDVDVARVNGASNYNAYQLLPDLAPRSALVEDLDSGEVYRIDTDTMERRHIHVAEDDGTADEVLHAQFEDAEVVQKNDGSDENDGLAAGD